MMLKWAKDLIIGTSVTGKSAGIMKKLDAGETVTMYFLITLTRGADQLEIINTAYLACPRKPSDDHRDRGLKAGSEADGRGSRRRVL